MKKQLTNPTDLTTDESQETNHVEPGTVDSVPTDTPLLVESTKFYTIEGADEEELEDEDEEGFQDDQLSSEFASPFQLSGAMPYVEAEVPHGSQPLAPSRKARRTSTLLGIIAISVVLLILGGLFLVSAFAKPAMPAQQSNGSVSTAAPKVMATHVKSAPTQHTQSITPAVGPVSSTPIVGTMPQGVPQANEIPSGQLLQQLGWTTAGLSLSDAIQSERTAVTFTDREESLVFSEAGTRTAATFLLTPAARNRFTQNDVRVSSNTLWNSVQQQQLIRLAVNEQAVLVKQIAQGQNQFAWVDVQFELWQSRIDPQNTNQRQEGLENDPATNAPRIHHMIVLLLRVAPGSEGANAPMGGTGWLVSNYALDPAAGTLPGIVVPA